MENNNTEVLGPCQINDSGERFYYYLNPGTFSKLNSTLRFEANYSKLLFKKDTIYIIVGTDSGLLPQYVQEVGIPEGARYIFIEPAIILNALKAEDCFSSLDERILCVDEHEWLNAIEQFKIESYFYIDSVMVVDSLAASQDQK